MTSGRIAFASPLPPETSGIADYSATLLPELTAEYDLSVFTRHPERSRELLSAPFDIRSYGEMESHGGETAIYQIGNHHPFHGEIYRLALQRPGIAVLHEYVLHDLVRESAISRGGARAYADELRYALGRTGDALSRRVEAAGEGLSSFTWPLFERVVDRSLCTVVHGEMACRRIHASRPNAEVVVAPHHVSEHAPDTTDLLAFRDRHGIGRDTLLVAAFGVVAPTKQLDLALAAFDAIQAPVSRCLLIVGEGGRSWLGNRRPGDGGGRYLALGRVEDDELRCAMASCDVAINLRDPTGGETSGTCLRLLALGATVIVSDQGWFSEIPDDCCAKVPVDAAQQAELAALLEGVATNPQLRRQMGRNARQWTAHHHSLQATVRAYGEAIERAKAARPAPPPAPPLAPFSRNDVLSELIQEVSAAAGDLGITEQDEPVLAELAKTVVGLGLGRDAVGD